MADKRKAQNEAFVQRAEAGDGTPLDEKKLRFKILAEEIRREEAEARVEKQREKARKQSEKVQRRHREKEREQKEQSKKAAKKRPRVDNQDLGDLKKKKVEDLKKICKDKGLDHRGRKLDLVKRLQDADPVAPGTSWGSEAPSGQNGEQAAQGVASSGSGGEVPADRNGGQAAQGIASSGSGGEVPTGQNGEPASYDDSSSEGSSSSSDLEE